MIAISLDDLATGSNDNGAPRQRLGRVLLEVMHHREQLVGNSVRRTRLEVDANCVPAGPWVLSDSADMFVASRPRRPAAADQSLSGLFQSRLVPSPRLRQLSKYGGPK